MQRRAQVGRGVEEIRRRLGLAGAEQRIAHVDVRLGQRRVDRQDFVQRGDGVVELTGLQHRHALLETLVGASRLRFVEELVRAGGGGRLPRRFRRLA